MDLNNIETITDGLPYMRIGQARYLAQRFAEWLPLNILEIGTYHGTGACYLGEMVRQRGGHVTTVDLPPTRTNRESADVEGLLERCGLDNVTVTTHAGGAEGFMFEHLLSANPPFDFVYIDGGHQWHKTVPQFCLAMVCLRSGGWMLFDDINNSTYPDVGTVWEHVVKQHPGVTEIEEHDEWGFAQRA